MSQAIVDPEELRRFAAELKRFNGDREAVRRQAVHFALEGLLALLPVAADSN